MKSLIRLSFALVVLAISFSACNNPVNNGYKYGYPVLLKADSTISNNIGFDLKLAATVPDLCWEIDQVNLAWENDSVADVHVLCRHDISASCKIQDTTLHTTLPVIAPYSHVYSVKLYNTPNSAVYSTLTIKK